MPKDKRSFFERLTGSYNVDEEEIQKPINKFSEIQKSPEKIKDPMQEMEEEVEEGQLTIDVFQTPTDIIVQTFVAGVKPEDLDISITQEMFTIKGRRQEARRVEKDDYFYQELYWGSFSRSILLPQEVDTDEAEATQKNGVLTIKLPKLDKERVQKLKIKSE